MADLSWVNDRLAIGGKVDSLADARTIAGKGITHVLSLRNDIDDEQDYWKRVGGVKFANAPQKDDGEPKPAGWFKKGIEFAHGALLENPTAKVLIHCRAGKHRAPAMAYAVLRALGIPKDDAREHVHESRKVADVDEYADDAERALKALGYT